LAGTQSALAALEAEIKSKVTPVEYNG